MKFLAKINAVYDRVCLKFSLFVLNHPGGYMAVTALLGSASLLILLAPEAGAQLARLRGFNPG